jgi:flagellar motor switch protein FliG
MSDPRKAAELLVGLDNESREKILKNVAEKDPALAQAIRDSLFLFEDLVKLEARDLQILIRETNALLSTALRSASETTKDVFFKNMSTRAAETLREEIAASPPRRLSEVEKAQKDIVDAAHRLAEQGKIQLPFK